MRAPEGVCGVGVDIVETARIARLWEAHGERFLHRICREGEAVPGARADWAQHLSGLFAAKEAVLKALGTGWAAGLSFRQIEIVHTAHGAPQVELHGAARARAATLGVGRVWISISHERQFAIALAILVAGGEP